MTNIIDQAVREQAINIHHSYIVQAPAGSGKTELLTQRFLALLSTVDKSPEEVLAITFTQKAAGEMRERILKALLLAENQPAPALPHACKTWQLAKKVLERDQQEQWLLTKNPNRLRIMTLDALAAYLCQQLPLSSNSFANFSINKDALNLYETAVFQFIQDCLQHTELRQLLQDILIHLDNRMDVLTNMLCQLLGKREQWLSHIMHHQNDDGYLRQHLEQSLATIIQEKIQAIAKLVSRPQLTAWYQACATAGNNLIPTDPHNPICQAYHHQALPEDTLADFPCWHAFSQFFLTKSGGLRKTIDKRQGVITSTEHKQAVLALLAEIETNPTLLSALQAIQTCPPLHYPDKQWQIIAALLTLLPRLTAHLTLLFNESQQIDFIELNLAALRALGSADEPTDLALHLDYRIKHILIDEFQDTSITQYTLLERLIAGWQAGDGRTLFLVGDPMQSIYRFREAEVSLFLRAMHQGINNIALTPLTLQQNFRSTNTIIDWVNHSFSAIFPLQSDILTGAVSYTPAQALQQSTEEAIYYYCCNNNESLAEALQVSKIIVDLQKTKPQESIAILVRARTHLKTICQQLTLQHIPYQAVEIETLQDAEEIQDLFSLTCALLHRADRIAWLSILRAPFCGLTLQDLYAITAHQPKRSLWHTLQDYQNIPDLSADAKLRLRMLTALLQNFYAQLRLHPFTHCLKQLWQQLSTSSCYQSPNMMENCHAYFQLLLQMQANHLPLNRDNLDRQLQKLYSQTSVDQQCSLQIMTMHKAKGLEFDHVIIPGLNRQPTPNRAKLLTWLERPNQAGENDLLMATVKAADSESDDIYQYINTIEKKRLANETKRLLYVAATRAKQSLHLIASVTIKKDNVALGANSLLQILWPVHQHSFLEHLAQQIEPENQATSTEPSTVTLKRLHATAYAQPPTAPIDSNQLNHNVETHIEDKTPQIVGTVIHAVIQFVAELSTEDRQTLTTKQLTSIAQQQFISHGLLEKQINLAIQQTVSAIQQMLHDPRGQWILSHQHTDAHNEYPLTGVLNGKIMHYIIDRCFVEDHSTQWIIDYKTATPKPQQSLAAFLQQEKLEYQQQLQQYATVFAKLTNKPIHCALYFPLCNGWISWAASDTSTPMCMTTNKSTL